MVDKSRCKWEWGKWISQKWFSSETNKQNIIWTNAEIVLIGPLGTNFFSGILIEIHAFSFRKMHLKMSSGKWRPFCLGLMMLYRIVYSKQGSNLQASENPTLPRAAHRLLFISQIFSNNMFIESNLITGFRVVLELIIQIERQRHKTFVYKCNHSIR